MSCKKVTATAFSLAEIYKRVPPNQIQNFEVFRSKNAEYQDRVNLLPDKLPRIDWEYYRTNVRAEMVSMVDEFEKKYAELIEMFNGRQNLDHSKYYTELETSRKEIAEEIEQYKAESNERIAIHETEIEYLRNMKPYSHMTMEEFCTLMPEKAKYVPYYGNNELFWPFDPDEQVPDPYVEQSHAENAGGEGGPAGEPGQTIPEVALSAAGAEAVATMSEPEVLPTIKQDEKQEGKDAGLDKEKLEEKCAETADHESIKESESEKSPSTAPAGCPPASTKKTQTDCKDDNEQNK